MSRTASPSESSAASTTRIQTTTTTGRCGGVGNPITFAPLHDRFERTTHYARSDDAPREQRTFVSLSTTDEILDGIQAFAGLDADAGWWCMDQTDGAWFGTGLDAFRQQLRVPHTNHYPIMQTHHHGAAVWISPVDAVAGVEAIVFAGDAARDGESRMRRPTVSVLLNDPRLAALPALEDELGLPFFETPGNPESGISGMAVHEAWPDHRGQAALPATGEHTVTVRHLETVDGPRGPELEVTNPYYGDPGLAAYDLGPGQFTDTTTGRLLARRLAAYERVTAHPADHAAFDPTALQVNDRLRVTGLELTAYLDCAISFGPMNAELHVTDK